MSERLPEVSVLKDCPAKLEYSGIARGKERHVDLFGQLDKENYNSSILNND